MKKILALSILLISSFGAYSKEIKNENIFSITEKNSLNEMPTVDVDTIFNIEVRSCKGETYNLENTLQEFISQLVDYVYADGVPSNYNSDFTKSEYISTLKNILIPKYTDLNNVELTNYTAVSSGKYRVWISQKENASSVSHNRPNDSVVDVINNMYYNVEVTTKNLSSDFLYPTSIKCNETAIRPSITGNNTGNFAFRLKKDSKWVNSIGSTTINFDSGVIENVIFDTIYEVKYILSPQECEDSEKIKSFTFHKEKIDITSVENIYEVSDMGICTANVILQKPNVTNDCASIDNLYVTIDSIEINIDDFNLEEYTFPTGESKVTYRMLDTNRDTIYFEYSVIIMDDQAPTITNMPKNMIVEHSFPDCETKVSWVEPSINDNCDKDITPTITGIDEYGNEISVTNGGSFPIGKNTITYHVIDKYNNSNEVSFTITVEDNNPAKIDLDTFPKDVSLCNDYVNIPDVKAVFSCGGHKIINDFNDGGENASDTYPPGETIVTFSLIDRDSTVLDSKYLVINIYSDIEVNIDGPSIVEKGREININSNIVDELDATYKWIVVSGKAQFINNTNNNATATLSIAGDTYIKLEITTDSGCTATSNTLKIRTKKTCQIPNVITPNEDGINDLFVIPCIESYGNNHITIYDRWGQVVFEKNNYSNNWYGTNKYGNKLNGTYYYRLSSINKPVETGYIVVLR